MISILQSVRDVDLAKIFNIGDTVEKLSGKPFKSGLLVATIKGAVQSPYSGRLALEFYEDDSVVDAYRCRLVH